MNEREIFLALLDLPDAAARADFLNEACGGDPAKRAGVEALFASHETAGDFLADPAVSPPDADAIKTQAWSGEEIPTSPAIVEDEALEFLAPSDRSDSLGRIGHYEVLEVLGRGGFGIVFRAFDETLQRVVAVKVLAPQMAATSPARKRFLREARSSAKVRHANIVQVYAVEEKPLPFLVMEYIPGETLQQRLNRTGPLDTAEIVRIGRQIAEGLAAAHDTGLIHRDIKPANILIEPAPHEHVKITDFGLARAADDASATQSGIVAGTPMFMSPEQAKGERIDHRADLFSLGSVLYAMCTGRAPFRANSSLAVLKRVTEDTPRPISEIIPEVPPWLCEIVARLHAKRPEDRFASAQAVADALARGQSAAPSIEEGEPLPPTISHATKPGVHYKRTWLGAAIALVALLGGLGVSEATGVTNVRGTVIRLFSPEGTLVIEVDDPGVSVVVDGEDMVITGLGVKEVRLKPGRYKVEASRDGKLISQELVTISNNGRQVVRVTREGGTVPTSAKPAPAIVIQPAIAATEWEKSVAMLPAEEQANAVVAELKRRNPVLHCEFKPVIRGPSVTAFVISGSGISDISPVRALTDLDYLECRVNPPVDLSPLQGMQSLKNLSVRGTETSDLRMMTGMKLRGLEVSSSHVQDLSPLHGMPLEELQTAWTPVKTLEPLKGMKLVELNCSDTKVADLTPIQGMPMRKLNLKGTSVSDLSPLKGMRLEFLDYTRTPVSDISVLKGMPLREVRCDFQVDRDRDILRSIKTLKTINETAADGFWNDSDQK